MGALAGVTDAVAEKEDRDSPWADTNPLAEPLAMGPAASTGDVDQPERTKPARTPKTMAARGGVRRDAAWSMTPPFREWTDHPRIRSGAGPSGRLDNP